MTIEGGTCVHCGVDAATAPLLLFEYQGRTWRICSRHLPVLIHDPASLVGRLPGAEGLSPADHHD